MSERYFVLHHRDFETEKYKKYEEEKMLFDYCRTFRNLDSAVSFASDRLPAVIGKQFPISESDKKLVAGLQKPYLVVGHFYGKYSHHSYDGSSDPLHSYDVVRCDESDIEKWINAFSEEEAEKIFGGIELKIAEGLLGTGLKEKLSGKTSLLEGKALKRR